MRREEERGRREEKPFFPPFSPRLSRSDPQYLEKVFEDVWEGGREFSAEKLNLPYSSDGIWDLSLLTAPQGTDMIFRTTLQLPKIPSSLPRYLPGCIALLCQKGESNLSPRKQIHRGEGKGEQPCLPLPLRDAEHSAAENARRKTMSCSEGAKAINVGSRDARFPGTTLMNNFGDSYGFR